VRHQRVSRGKGSPRRLGRSKCNRRRLSLGKSNRRRLSLGKSNRRRLSNDHNRRPVAKRRILPHRPSLVIRRRRPQGLPLRSLLMVSYRYGIRRSLRRPNKAS
jgi:hypothetical protein